MTGLLTDLYQLTMAAGYFEAGKAQETATFELFFRNLPRYRNYVLAAGLEQVVDYLANLKFHDDEIAYLRSLPQFRRVSSEFFESLRGLRFTGDLFAMREGTPIFAGQPLLTIRAPLIEAQIAETYLLATVGFQSLIATKAARIVEVAGGRAVVDFGTRRAHSPEAGVLAGRASYIGGCAGTSNTETGFRYGIPVFGTAAHSWIQSFRSELEAFERLQSLLGDATVYLIDTYDTVQGARLVASLGGPLWGVRLDSGNLVELSRQVRKVLDEAGLTHAKIMATSDLNEYKILEFAAAGAPIDAFGVGTDLATSADSPNLGVVYKLVELDGRFTAKFSEDKHTLPGSKQVFRFAGHDVIACSWECLGCGHGEPQARALLRPVMLHGELVEPLPGATAARQYAAESIKCLPTAVRSLFDTDQHYRVEYSRELVALYEKMQHENSLLRRRHAD
ncbi:MAG TPA: nicotinate phosphoribosyltransferase [Bryobacteraceae bacterium]|nr:nicotinate phosphoribosyltransferase [Bryobacteraceae bacterium]